MCATATWCSFSTFAPTARDNSRQAFLEPDFQRLRSRGQPRVHFVTLTEYDKNYGCARRLLRRNRSKTSSAKWCAETGRKQLRIAETEKYPHVTYFFNGGVEKQFPGEDRVIIPSPKDVPTYDNKPQMSAPEVTRKVVELLPSYDLVILNFANPDMVGHTGVVEAGIKAVETIDDCVRQVVEKSTGASAANSSSPPTTATANRCATPTVQPNTAHTTNLVHFIYVAADAANFQTAKTVSSPTSRRRCFPSSASNNRRK